MACTPGFFPPLGRCISGWQVCNILIHVLDGDCIGKSISDRFFEFSLDILSDNKNHFAKSGPDGIVDGIIDYELPVRSHRVDLLQTAVTAAHSCG